MFRLWISNLASLQGIPRSTAIIVILDSLYGGHSTFKCVSTTYDIHRSDVQERGDQRHDSCVGSYIA